MKPKVFLFQHVAYLGGVWQATRSLVQSLYRINCDRGQLELRLGLSEEQRETESLRVACPNLEVANLRCITKWGFQLLRERPERGHWINPLGRYVFFTPGDIALESDLWCAMVDRFRRPLAPMRPYGLIIHDMIHKHSPEAFSKSFNRRVVPRGIAPTVRRAMFQVTTTAATARDVIEFYGTPEPSMRIIPVAHCPDDRFTHIPSRPIRGLPESYFLNISNASPHKGSKTMLEGYLRWRRSNPDGVAKLVICGCDTDSYSASGLQSSSEYVNQVRERMRDSGLSEGRDVLFLGYVDDGALKYLFEHSTAVVNSAAFDNGSYSMIESVWFGKPLISSDYPAARYVNHRFDLDAIFFEAGNADALANALEKVSSAPNGHEGLLAKKRSHLMRKELSQDVFAERFYEMLVEQASSIRQTEKRPGKTTD